MASGSTIVGSVVYEARYDLAQLRKDAKAADKIVEQSYNKQAKASAKASKSTSGSSSSSSAKGSSYDAQTRVNAIKREAQASLDTISQYAPQVQKQFLTVERANNAVYNSTVRSTNAIAKYGSGSSQATQATNGLNIAVQNQSQQQSKLTSMLNGTYKSQASFSQSLGDGAVAIGGVVASLITLQTTISVVKNSVRAANEYEAALTGLSRLSKRFGEDNKLATASAEELASDGLITVATAAGSLQKLLTAGVGLPQAIELLKGYKDQAAFGRSSTLDLDTAVGNLAESFYTENSAIGNLSGQTENWAQILEYGASALGKTVSQLTAQERITAKVIGQQRLNNLVQGDAAVYASTNAGNQQRLNATLKEMQVTIGQVTNQLTSGLIGALSGLDKEQQKTVISVGAGAAAFITIATIAPVVVKGIRAIRAAIISVGVANAFATAGISALVGGLAALAVGFGVSALIDSLDEADASTESMNENVAQVASGLGTGAANAADMAKQVAKINDEMEKTREDYRYSLAELVSEKNKNIATLLDTLSEEERAYNNAYAERLASFRKSDNEEQLSHAQKTKKLQNQIDFLTKYNTSANKKQLSELQFSLAQENAEYTKSTALRQGEFDAQTQSEAEEYQKRRDENQTKLNEELALLEKHRQDVLGVRNVILLDEIDKLKQSRDAQLASLEQQKADIVGQLGGAAKEVAKVAGDASVEASKKLAQSIFNMNAQLINMYGAAARNGDVKINSAGELEIKLKKGGTIPYSSGFAEGGYTGRGGVNDVAGVVHKGEYVLPQSAVDQSTGTPKATAIQGQNVTVNISMSGIMSSSPSDERAIAVRIGKRINEALKAKGQPVIPGLA